MDDPIAHDVESGNGLQILEWPSGALEFRRTEVGGRNKFQCFVVSGADRKKFLEKLDEISNTNG